MKHRNAIAGLGVFAIACMSGATNVQHGWGAMVHAAFNQAIHTGISAMTIMKLHACVAERCVSRASQILPAVIPAAVSAAICYTIHKLGIPGLRDPSAEPLLSSIPTFIMLSIVMPIYHYAYRHHRNLSVSSAGGCLRESEP